MQLLAGIQRPTTIYRPQRTLEKEETGNVPEEEGLTAERLALKTVKLALLLRSRREFTIFQGLGINTDSPALPTALFMLIRANRLSVSGGVVETALGLLRGLSELGVGGLGKVANGEWALPVVLEQVERARMLKFLTEWRMARKGVVVSRPLEAYLGLTIKRSSKKHQPDQDNDLQER